MLRRASLTALRAAGRRQPSPFPAPASAPLLLRSSLARLLSEPVRLRLPEDEATAGTKRCITRWFKNEGDEIKSGEALCEVDSGEVVFDFVSPVNGIMVKITAYSGSVDLKGGEVIAFVASSADAITSAKYTAQKEIAEGRVVVHGGPKPADDSTDGPVAEWLHSLGPDMEQYAKALKDDGFDSLESLATLTEDDLTAMAVTKKGHRNLILKGVAAMKQPEAAVKQPAAAKTTE